MKNEHGMDLFQQFIYLSRYSRWRWNEKRRETWPETVDRYVEFMKSHMFDKYSFRDEKLFEEIRSHILGLKVMPSMRALMTAGKALERDNIAGYNCAYLPINHQRAFDELMYILLNGCLHEDTLVKTDKDEVRISELTKDHKVLSFNFEDDEYEFVQPEWVGETDSLEKEKLELEFEDGSIVKCTEDHEFFTTNRGWIKAKDLTDDDDIQNYNEIN